MLARTLAALAAVVASAAIAAPAHAQPVRTTPTVRCPVEDEHGNVTWVDVGTVVGMWRCGADGEWHFGWLVTDRAVRPPGDVLQP